MSDTFSTIGSKPKPRIPHLRLTIRREDNTVREWFHELGPDQEYQLYDDKQIGPTAVFTNAGKSGAMMKHAGTLCNIYTEHVRSLKWVTDRTEFTCVTKDGEKPVKGPCHFITDAKGNPRFPDGWEGQTNVSQPTSLEELASEMGKLETSTLGGQSVTGKE